MKEVVEFGAIFFSSILIHIIGMLSYLKNPDKQKSRTVSEIVLVRWVYALGAIFVVLLIANNQQNGLASIGINLNRNDDLIFGLGLGYVGIAAIFSMIYLVQKYILHNLNNDLTENIQQRPDVFEALKFNGGMERFLYFSIMPFEVIAEDIVYLGYLVLLLGNRTGTFLPWAILSVVLSVIIHLYQGKNWKIILYHFISASFLVFVTVITQNIFVPFGFHFFNNLGSTIGVWRRADRQGISKSESESRKGILAGWFIFASLNYLFLFFLILCVSVF